LGSSAPEQNVGYEATGEDAVAVVRQLGLEERLVGESPLTNPAYVGVMVGGSVPNVKLVDEAVIDSGAGFTVKVTSASAVGYPVDGDGVNVACKVAVPTPSTVPGGTL
jgi:hypothetical protein